MKKIIYWVLAATLVCGSSVFESCSNNSDNTVQPQEKNMEWVDLGLPSGLLWGACNIGANAPEESGDYLAFGVGDRNQLRKRHEQDTYPFL
ncbi:MAG: hypothetical protein IJ615_09980 [Bacteroidaceae bacterium]|nr:hypothetical protein [Bacteroidaceae bacterium]